MLIPHVTNWCFIKGDPNASIPTIEPMIVRPMFAARLPSTSIMFVSQASIDNGVVQSYGLRKRIEAVKGCRTVGKKDMKFNDAMPKMKVDPESYVSWNPVPLFVWKDYANL